MRALLDAIIADPDDDEARLVYGDWLEAQGDSRGELIQLEVQLARMDVNDPRREALRARADEIDKLHARDWLADLWSLRLPQTKFFFRRGFVELMDSTVAVATEHADALLERAPLLSVLDLSVVGQRERMALAVPKSTRLLANARELSIRGLKKGNTWMARGPIGRLEALARTPFTRLRELKLAGLRVDARELGGLVASPHVESLEALRLDLGLDSTARIVDTFGMCTLPNLRWLDLSGNWMGDDGAAALVHLSFLEGVTTLDLSRTNVSLAGIGALEARFPRLLVIRS